jgi:hypothetical protein
MRVGAAHVTHDGREVVRFRDHLDMFLAGEQQPEAATHHP